MLDGILRYLNGSSGQRVWMRCNESSKIVGYCDVDWTCDRVDTRSTTCYCTFIWGNLVTWKSKKAEYCVFFKCWNWVECNEKAFKKLVWIKVLLKDLGNESETQNTVHCDNQAAIHITSNSMFHERTEYIKVDCHKVRQLMVQGVIFPCYTRSEDNLADVFTKAARWNTIEYIHSRLRLIDLSQP